VPSLVWEVKDTQMAKGTFIVSGAIGWFAPSHVDQSPSPAQEKMAESCLTNSRSGCGVLSVHPINRVSKQLSISLVSNEPLIKQSRKRVISHSCWMRLYLRRSILMTFCDTSFDSASRTTNPQHPRLVDVALHALASTTIASGCVEYDKLSGRT